jgi:hypothetical protein
MGDFEPGELISKTIEALLEAMRSEPNRLFLHKLGLPFADPNRLRIRNIRTTTNKERRFDAVNPDELDAVDEAEMVVEKPRKRRASRTEPLKDRKRGAEAARKPFWKFW